MTRVRNAIVLQGAERMCSWNACAVMKLLPVSILWYRIITFSFGQDWA